VPMARPVQQGINIASSWVSRSSLFVSIILWWRIWMWRFWTTNIFNTYQKYIIFQVLYVVVFVFGIIHLNAPAVRLVEHRTHLQYCIVLTGKSVCELDGSGGKIFIRNGSVI
jgi:hypothetical protein